MSDEAATTATTEAASTTDGNTSGETSTASADFKPITSQEDLNRLIADRIKRAEAKFADYKDAKTKAQQYDAMVESQKTELQKIQERAEAAEKRAADLEAAEAQRIADAEAAKQIESWKADVAKKTGVPVDVLRGTTQEDIAAHAESLKALLPDPNARKVGGAYVPAEGRGVTTTADPRQQFADILKQA
jgi:hypothetical protein